MAERERDRERGQLEIVPLRLVDSFVNIIRRCLCHAEVRGMHISHSSNYRHVRVLLLQLQAICGRKKISPMRRMTVSTKPTNRNMRYERQQHSHKKKNQLKNTYVYECIHAQAKDTNHNYRMS